MCWEYAGVLGGGVCPGAKRIKGHEDIRKDVFIALGMGVVAAAWCDVPRSRGGCCVWS